MRQSATLPIVFLMLTASTITANTFNPSRTGILKREAQLSCPAQTFDILCAADSGTTICHDRLGVCCQLSDGKTPYTCNGMDEPHCCGTDKPACGADPTCKNIKGDRDVVSAQDVVYPTAMTVSVASSMTATRLNPFASGTAAATVELATVTGERNPNVTGGADVLRSEGVIEKCMLVILAMAIALL
ncbi:hypothetical protein P153DRAFT_363477 [Dothidotthia symphoricarpi CBS 119687]|uniref:GPI anchored serine-threonine rich protein n=1 Tax=Dothidotthia symphoricarpi CBS 119687 TaxID=1392245 RepID=A0A6A6APY5_9PLEO|nr:uncharacterized protein P153DRAFT_363477 [Dothidotthia symphoricarpi CBS 119687]KAF2133263.1 hypothetical protein P153DRAFT_363477 [Dothidotthia symphoricarpi CBS 119687]